MSVQILIGDVFDKMATLEDNSVDCCVSSFPYWGLRDYGVDGQIGLEPTLGEHIEVVVRVCEEIRRVLKPEGTFWLNYGDCYATKPNGKSAAAYKEDGSDDRTFRDKPFDTTGPIYAEGQPSTATRGFNSGAKQVAAPPSGRIMAGGLLKPKDLCMIPNRIAIALQEAGWWVRSEIIWHKPNPMPESVTDRPTTCHEKIFLLTKSQRYFYDHEAVKEAYQYGADHHRNVIDPPVSHVPGAPMHSGLRKGSGNKSRKHGDSAGRPGDHRGRSIPFEYPKRHRGSTPRHDGHIEHTTLDEYPRGEGRNLRNVWTVATKPFPEAHFATFPPELIEPCIKAGCPEGGLVLDPFGGAGTTGLVADRLKRHAILIELNPEYAEIAERRLSNDAGMFADISAA